LDAGLTIKPMVGVAVPDYVPLAATAHATASTELPTKQTVTAASEATPPSNDPIQRGNSASDYAVRSITIDPQSREVIYRVIDSRTNQVVGQMPDMIQLRNRAYMQAIANGTTSFDALTKADLET
jgi:hypothetical protein